MTGWIVLGAVLIFLLLLSMIRFGGQVRYDPDGLSLRLILGPVRIRLLPAKSEKSKKRVRPRRTRKREKPSPVEDDRRHGTVGQVLELLPVLAEAAGALKRKIRIDRLDLNVIWGAENAASAALGYGRANALLGMIWPLLDNNFKVKNCQWNVDVDYDKSKPELTADAAITASIGQLLCLAVRYGVKLLRKSSRSKERPAGQQEV